MRAFACVRARARARQLTVPYDLLLLAPGLRDTEADRLRRRHGPAAGLFAPYDPTAERVGNCYRIYCIKRYIYIYIYYKKCRASSPVTERVGNGNIIDR